MAENDLPTLAPPRKINNEDPGAHDLGTSHSIVSRTPV